MLSSLSASVLVFVLAALAIVTAGSRLARLADELADRTGMGEALFGVLLLAGVTALPDFAAILSASLDARPDLAISSIMGSMAMNLAFLGVADILYRKANLEHAAASPANLMLAGLLVVLLTLPLLAMVLPVPASWQIHPATVVIVLAYVFGLHLVHRTQEKPMWFPRRTFLTVADQPGHAHSGSLGAVWLRFGVLAAITCVSGWVLMEAAKGVASQSLLSDTLVGGVFTALATSTPELVTTIAAIRVGALTLAVSNIFGTNCFNMLVVVAADIAYPGSSIFVELSPLQMMWGLVCILMTSILLLGMVRRETYGIGRIGFESALILLVYGAALATVVAAG